MAILKQYFLEHVGGLHRWVESFMNTKACETCGEKLKKESLAVKLTDAKSGKKSTSATGQTLHPRRVRPLRLLHATDAASDRDQILKEIKQRLPVPPERGVGVPDA